MSERTGKAEALVFGLDQISTVVEEVLIPRLATKRIFTFEGPLGAGKTTMVKAFLAACGVKDVVTSPTFSYVKKYQGGIQVCRTFAFYHFDLYRLDSASSFFDLGFEEFLHEEGSVSVIEWPEIINEVLLEKGLVEHVCAVKLNYVPGDLEKRELVIEKKI